MEGLQLARHRNKRHSIRDVAEALDLAGEIHDRPAIILAHTTKGKGVSFMENQSYWHGMYPMLCNSNRL